MLQEALLLEPPAPGPAVSLRHYQTAARQRFLAGVNACLPGHDGPVNRPLIVHPTGCGKTVLFARLIAELQQGMLPIERELPSNRVLMIAHRGELLDQAYDKLRREWPEAPIGYVDGRNVKSYHAPIVMASIQTIYRKAHLAELGSRPFGLVIVDEAHHAEADSYQEVLGHLGCFAPGGPLLLGVTATPERGDGKGLGRVFQKVVHNYPILDAIRDGYLCRPIGRRVELDLDLSKVRTKGSKRADYQDGSLAAALVAADAPEHIVEAWMQHASDRKATLVFTPTVELATQVALAFQAAGVPAVNASAIKDKLQRRKVLEQLRSGELRVVTNAALFTEGLDVAEIDCVVIARPTKSIGLFKQMVGRGTRPHPGKQDVLILMVSSGAASHNLASVGTLFWTPGRRTRKDVDEVFEGADVLEAVEELEADAAELEQEDAAAAAAEQQRLQGILVSTAVEFFQGAWDLHWLTVTPELLMLPLGRDGQDRQLSVTIVKAVDGNGQGPAGDLWQVREHCGDALSVLHDGAPMQVATRTAEQAARRVLVRKPMAERPLYHPRGAWRQEAALPTQKAALVALGVPEATVDRLSRGEAADAILRHNAQDQLGLDRPLEPAVQGG